MQPKATLPENYFDLKLPVFFWMKTHRPFLTHIEDLKIRIPVQKDIVIFASTIFQARRLLF